MNQHSDMDANARKVRALSKFHMVACYDSPCIHWSVGKGIFQWFCVCSESGLGNQSYEISLAILREHQNSCDGEPAAVPAEDVTSPLDAIHDATVADCD